MIKPFLALFVILVLVSCKKDYKKCPIQTNDVYLKAYNEILNEIITNHSYGRYLGEEQDRIFDTYADDIADSSNISQEMIYLHNKRFNDTSIFCTIYLDTFLRPAISPWWYYQKDTNSFRIVLKDLISKFSSNEQAVIDTINSIQTNYLPNDFKLCIANLVSIQKVKEGNSKCGIGKISFSKLIFNQEKVKGLLYYEFRCGELCGYGNIIVIEKVNGHWKIETENITWIS